ncbi:hypothetical protein N2152v2_001423 [Parachlorella kessleri]
MQAAEAFNISGHVSRLQARDLPSALAGLFNKAETVLRPSSKNSRERRLHAGTPAPQKRALATAIVLLLDRAGELQDQFPEIYQAVQAKLLAAFQQHPWLWERLLRVDMQELLGRPHATGLVVEALLLLDGRSQARALTLLRLQLQHSQQQGQELLLDRTAALQEVLARAFGALQQCFLVVSHLLPEPASHSGATTQRPATESGRLQVQLWEQLPALLHLVLVLTCQQDGQVPAEEGMELGNGQRSSRSSTAASCDPAVAAAQQDKGVEEEAGATTSVGNSCKEGALRYAAVLLQRLSQPEALHDALGLTLCQAAAAQTAPGLATSTWAAAAGATAAEQSNMHGGCSGKLGGADLLRIQSAQQTMEVLMEALVTLPGVAAVAALACSTPSIDASSQAQASGQVPHSQQQQQQPSQLEGDGGDTGNPAVAVSQLVAALLALHWELAKLRVACASEAEGKCSKGLGGHLSQEGCLQLLRLAASNGHITEPAVQLRCARMPRHTGGGTAVTLPPVQLLLPPSVISHLLDLIGQAMESPSWVERRSADAYPAAGSTQKGQAGKLESLSSLAAAVLEIQQACFQGLSQPGLVLRGLLHRQAIAAASKLHFLLTQPPATGTGAAQATTATAAAAAAASDMAAQAGLEEEGRARPMRAAARKRSLPGSFSLAALEGRAEPAKRSRVGVVAAPGNGTPAGGETAVGGQPAGGTWAPVEVANPVADLLQLLGLGAAPEQPRSLATSAGEINGVPTATALQRQDQHQQQQRRDVPAGLPLNRQAASARKRISPQPVVPLMPPLPPQQLTPNQSRDQQAPQVQKPPAPHGTAFARKRVTPALVATVPAGAREPCIATEPQQESGPAQLVVGSDVAPVPKAALLPKEATESGPPPAQQHSWQQEDGRVHLTGASGLDDAGKEALWAAYIADKELLLELMGDTDYQVWFDEAAHPLPEGVPAIKEVETLLDDVLGSPAGSKGISAAVDADSELLGKLPPGPGTVLEASLHLPWQAALAACLLLLQRFLERVLPPESVPVRMTSGGGSSRSLGGVTAAGAAEVESSREEPGRAGVVAEMLADVAQLLCGVLGTAQRGEAARQALAVAMPHYGPSHMDQAVKGASSHPIGGALLTLAMQLHGVAQKYCGLRTSPILLSAYTAVLSCLLPLAQQEAQQLSGAGHADARKAGRPPLQLVAPVGLQLLDSPRLRPSAMQPASVKCLLRLACPTAAPQPQPLPLLYGQTDPNKAQLECMGLAHSPLPPWLMLSASSLPQNLLLRPGTQSAAHAAAAVELVLLINAGVQEWEDAGGLEGLARGLSTAAPNQGAPLAGIGIPVPRGAGERPAPKARANGRGRRKRDRGKATSTAPAAPCQDVREGGPATTGVLTVASESATVAAAAAAAVVPTAAGRGVAVQRPGGSGSPSVEAMWPAIDACCTAVQWLLRPAEGMHGGLLGSDIALGGLLALTSRLALLCASALQMLASSLERPAGTVPQALHDAAVLWVLSLELEQWLREAETLSWPEDLLPSQLKLQGAVEELAGAQGICAELVRGLPDDHPLYPAILAAMEGAPSLFRFDPEEAASSGGESGEESGGRGLLEMSRGGLPGPVRGRNRSSVLEGDIAAAAPAIASRGRGCQPNLKGSKGALLTIQQQQQQQEDGQQAQGGRRRRRRRLKDIKNPALRAMIADGGCIAEDLEADDLSDLEDFIVHNPSRDYGHFFAEHFPQARADSGDEDESADESEGGQDGAEGLPSDVQAQLVGTEQLGTEGGTEQQQRSAATTGEGGQKVAAAAGASAASAGAAVARGLEGTSKRQCRGRPRLPQPRQHQKAQASAEAAVAAGTQVGHMPRRGRGRPRKQPPRQQQTAAASIAAAAHGKGEAAEVRRGRGRPRLPAQEPGQQEEAGPQQKPAQQILDGKYGLSKPVEAPASIWGRVQQRIPGLAAGAEQNSAAASEPPSADGLVLHSNPGRRSTRASSQAQDQDRSRETGSSGGQTSGSKARSRSSGGQPPRAGTTTQV